MDVDDFLSSCSENELKLIAERLNDYYHIDVIQQDIVVSKDVGRTYHHQIFLDSLGILSEEYDAISNEDAEIIINLAKKY